MIFSTYTFLVFFLTTLFVYAISPGRLKPYVLIAGGCVFYAYDSVPYFFLLLVVTLLVYALSRGARPALLTIGIIGSVGLLGFYKYWRMLARSWDHLFPGLSVPVYHVAVPLAISFFVFEFIHYLTDVRRGKVKPVGLTTFLVFIFFFPSMVAGPIKRIQSFQGEDHTMRWAEVQAGLTRMAIGTFKKIVFADSLNPLYAGAFADPAHYTQSGLWLGMYAYAFKIYMDFSAYSDMAIGAARCFGYTLPENFNWPYISRNLTEFWRRWHISLSTWIRDYLYISMGGSRKGYAKMLLFVFLSMTISGLWHGANWTFVIWGMWHGIGQVVQKLWNRLWERIKGESKPKRAAGALSDEGVNMAGAPMGDGMIPSDGGVKAIGGGVVQGAQQVKSDRNGHSSQKAPLQDAHADQTERSAQQAVQETPLQDVQAGNMPVAGTRGSSHKAERRSGGSTERRGRRWFWPFQQVAAWALTFHFVCIGWVFFASPDVPTAFRYLINMWTGG